MKPRGGLALGMGTLALLFLASGCGTRSQDASARAYIAMRQRAILYHAQQTPPGGAIIFGDSITELTRIPTICGLPALNAGVAGARLADVAAFAPAIITLVRPKLVVFAVGVNDARRKGGTPTEEWERAYHRLLKSYPRAIVVGIEPVEAGKPLGEAYFSTAAIAEYNKALRRIAARRLVAPLRSAPTRDGVHPTPEMAGAWRTSIEGACPLAETD